MEDARAIQHGMAKDRAHRQFPRFRTPPHLLRRHGAGCGFSDGTCNTRIPESGRARVNNGGILRIVRRIGSDCMDHTRWLPPNSQRKRDFTPSASATGMDSP